MIEVALFGAGRLGGIHAANLARLPGVKLKYVVDAQRAAALQLASQHRAEVRAADAVFTEKTVQAVVIASSPATHADLIQRAAAANMAIFCEKPVDLDLLRARASAQAVARAGVPCVIGFQRRFDPTFAALKDRLVAGDIGEPEMLVVTSREPSAPPVDQLGVSGGVFKDMLIHDFDVVRWILDDEAAAIYAAGSCMTDQAIASIGDIDSTVVSIRSRRGRLAQINTSRRAAYGYDQRFEILGSKGMLQAGNPRPTEVSMHDASRVSHDKPEYPVLERYRTAYAREIEHFIDVVSSGKPVRCSIQDGVKALELADAATRSWREKRSIEL
jgi:myo-inositol 2-dehydrogenase / D-chiro-inositol 1-dehydrogenase